MEEYGAFKILFVCFVDEVPDANQETCGSCPAGYECNNPA